MTQHLFSGKIKTGRLLRITLGKIGNKKVVEGASPYIDLCLRGNFNFQSRKEFSRTKEGFNRLCDLQWTQTRGDCKPLLH